MHDVSPFARAFFERSCLVGWVILMMTTTILIGLSVELLMMGSLFSLNQIYLIDHRTVPLLALGVVAALNFPVVIKLHELGVAHLNFEIHENILNNASESWACMIATLLDDDSTLRSNQLEKLVRAINNAPSAPERQERRAEAKAWLIGNKDRLTEDDKEIVLEHLSYLKIR